MINRRKRNPSHSTRKSSVAVNPKERVFHIDCCKNEYLNVAIACRLAELGYTVGNQNPNETRDKGFYIQCSVKETLPPPEYPNGYEPEEDDEDPCYDNQRVVSIERLFTATEHKYVKPPISVDLGITDDDYPSTIEITQDGLKCGCQIITYQKLDEINKAVARFRKEQENEQQPVQATN
jgi:hypothetical protein